MRCLDSSLFANNVMLFTIYLYTNIEFTCLLCDYFLADNLGKAVLAGASVVGIGSLCYYGLGLSNEAGAIDRAA